MTRFQIGLIIFCLSLESACAVIEDTSFDYQKISCHNQTSSTAEQEMEYQLQRLPLPLDDPNVSKTLLPVAKQYADQGNGWGMQLFGYFEFMRLLTTYAYQGDGKWDKEIPENIKPQIIVALSYLYLSTMTEHKTIDASKKIIVELRQKNSPVSIPPAWLDEAQVNAKRWKEYCEHEMGSRD